MTLHLCTGVEGPGSNAVDFGFDTNTSTIIDGVGSFGSRGANGGSLLFTIPTNIIHGWIGAFLKPSTNSDTSALIEVRDGTTVQLRVRLRTVTGSTYKLDIVRGNNIAVLGTGTTIFNIGDSHFFELEYTINPTTGVAKIWVDDSPESGLQLTAQNTRQSANSFANVAFWQTISGGMDDFYVNDDQGSTHNTRIGPTRSVWRSATAEGADTAGTANTGTKPNAVNEASTYTDDTSYISLAAAGDKQSFTIPALPTLTNIIAVYTRWRPRKDDVGAGTGRFFWRSSTPAYQNGPTENLSSGYITYKYLYPLDPFTSAAWTKTNVEAYQIGAEKVA